jgi:serine phosphatase RsbU (regulator of sigma subunit)
MIERPLLAVVVLAASSGVVVWGRSARRLQRAAARIAAGSGPGSDAAVITRSAMLKDVHVVSLYVTIAVVAAVGAVVNRPQAAFGLFAVVVPVALSVRAARQVWSLPRLHETRAALEQRAEEVLVQEALAPRRWSARLAPEDAPNVPGFEIGTLYRAGTGMMAGDFYDVFRTAPTRVAGVIGDVSGHGIEPSITAFQAKHLLRVFLLQFRDPAQALEELNAQLVSTRPEEFISMAVVMFDTEAGTVRYASAGHPPVLFWHGGEARVLSATGPLLALLPEATFTSREIELGAGDVVLMYTDGLAEARNGEHLFGEDRILNHLRRDPGADVDVLCKTLMEAAEDFASGPLNDDTAILAIRRV